MPIAYSIGITCRFGTYRTEPFPRVSKVSDGISHLVMSYIWLVKFLINKVTRPIFKATPLKTEILLNVTGKAVAGTGLTWQKLNHMFEFVKNMTQNWETE